MGRKRIHKTPEALRKANRLKSARHYARHKATINAKRRRGAENPHDPQEDIGSSMDTEKGEGLSDHAEQENHIPCKPQDEHGPLTQGVAKGYFALQLLDTPTRKLYEEDLDNDEAWDKAWHANRVKIAYEQHRAAEKHKISHGLDHYLKNNYVSQGGYTPIIRAEPETIDDNRPLWVREYSALRDALREIYEKVGATNLNQYLICVYHLHIDNHMHNKHQDLIGENHDAVVDLEHQVAALHDKTRFRYGSMDESTGYFERFRDRLRRTAERLDDMWMSNAFGTARLIEDFEEGRFPFLSR
ncbi:hypothetical protein VNI00_016535 [Paramarasmius palmivorus]|uniref:Uncharacterized protein n=1 Tax=Paramarasmius palmivorus TaxID=297713 RepID=A0AAW0BEA9_9AGAR